MQVMRALMSVPQSLASYVLSVVRHGGPSSGRFGRRGGSGTRGVPLLWLHYSFSGFAIHIYGGRERRLQRLLFCSWESSLSARAYLVGSFPRVPGTTPWSSSASPS